jgi:hypothetical protein
MKDLLQVGIKRNRKIIKASILKHSFFSLLFPILIAQDYGTGPPPEYYPEEYYDDSAVHKKKGFTVSIIFYFISF